MKLQRLDGGRLRFWCPGCDGPHDLLVGEGAGPRWCWNGKIDTPTFTPSVLVRTGHHVPGTKRRPDGNCIYCEENAREGEASDCSICHSFVTGGQIQFLTDSTHKLAGQTVPLPDYPEARP